MTVSGGIASIPDNSANAYDELLEMADKALYESKSKGKNQITFFNL